MRACACMPKLCPLHCLLSPPDTMRARPTQPHSPWAILAGFSSYCRRKESPFERAASKKEATGTSTSTVVAIAVSTAPVSSTPTTNILKAESMSTLKRLFGTSAKGSWLRARSLVSVRKLDYYYRQCGLGFMLIKNYVPEDLALATPPHPEITVLVQGADPPTNFTVSVWWASRL